MLSGLAVAAALTAAVAGVTGAWSPCGFSMVETVGSAMGDVRRGATLLAGATFSLGTLAGGAITFGGLALVGELIGGGVGGLREGLGAAIALAAAIADWRGVRIAPQIRRQVPERWRWTMPLPLACALYGVLLGLGFTTFVLAFAVWALAGISFAAGDPALGVLIGLAFGAGRALPVLWMAPALRGGRGGERLEEMSREPRLWLGLRRLDALGLAICALALCAASAGAAPRSASAGAARRPTSVGMAPRPASADAARRSASGAVAAPPASPIASATDPSAAAGALAWQQVGGAAMLLDARGSLHVLPGTHPALGGSAVAWLEPGGVTVADAGSLAPRLTLAAPGANALAVSDTWAVVRIPDAAGGEQLLGISLAAPGGTRLLRGAPLAGELGRPALSGASVVFTLDTPARSSIEMIDLNSGRAQVLRSAGRSALLLNPSLLDGQLLYERVTRCSQQLRLGSALVSARRSATRRRAVAAPAHDRLLLRLPSAVRRDAGYQRGYKHAYNGASRCRHRGPGAGGNVLLGASALGLSAAYATETATDSSAAQIITLPR